MISKTVFILFAFLLFPQIASSQEVRCDLISDNCLDYSDLTTVDVTLPVNTTRIAKDGLKTCLPSIELNQPFDLVFVLDQSGSMMNLDSYPDSDPKFETPKATTTALKLINQLAPASHVGLLGFANGLCDGTQKKGQGKGTRAQTPPNTLVPPASINDQTHYSSLLAQVDYNESNFYHDCGSLDSTGTSYYYSILQARDWLGDAKIAPHKKKVIVFLTDGQPNTKSLAQFQALVAASDSTNFPQVYAVFINGQQGDLQLLTQKTGGIFYPISQTNAIEGIFQEIIQRTVIPNKPITTVVNNTSNKASAASNSHTPAAADTNNFSLLLDGEVALLENANTVSFLTSTTFKPQDPYKKDVNFGVNGPAAIEKGLVKLPSPLFDLMCYDKSTIVPVDDNNKVLIEFPHTEPKLTAVLRTAPGVPEPVVSNLKGGVDDENLGLNPAGAGVFNGTIPFNNITGTPGNGTLETVAGENILLSWVHPRDPRDRADYTLPVVLNFPVENAWIKDADLDGGADRVFIRLKKRPSHLPDSITEIAWPSFELPQKKQTMHLKDTPELSPIQWGNAEQTIIVADLSSDPFEVGKTSADPVNPPSALIQGTSRPVLEDSVGAVILSAVKKPSDYKLFAEAENCSAFIYQDNPAVTQSKSNCTVDVMPDTLEIVLSEFMSPSSNVDLPWKELIYFFPGGNTSLTPVLVNIVGTPIVGADKVTWKVPISNKPDGPILKVNDVVMLNPLAPYADPFGNIPIPKHQAVTGRDGVATDVAFRFRRPVTGHVWYPTSTSFPHNVPIIDEKGSQVATLDAMEVSVWVPPVGLNANGMVDDVTASCTPNTDIGRQSIFPENCVSSFLVKTAITDGAYIAYVTIFDHYGTFIKSFHQKFGFCGELNNSERIISGRVVNDIVWNQRDVNGELVGSGVYIWRVKLIFSTGKQKDLLLRQGIARKEQPLANCIVQ